MALNGLDSLVAVTGIAAFTPVLTALLPGRLPQIVVFLVGGVLIGPQVAGLVEPDSIQLFADVGLGFLFLLAGLELEPQLFRARAGRLAVAAWVSSAVVAAVLVAALAATGFVHAYVPVALGLTTTALGALLPILSAQDMLHGRFRDYMISAGAVGELFPIVAIALFLSARSAFVALLSLLAVGVLALLLTAAPRLLRDRLIQRIVSRGHEETSQLALRWAILLLLVLLAAAARAGLDVVLGAFLAGMVLRHWLPDGGEALKVKLDAVAYGLFIPMFFVTSGMHLDVRSIGESPLRLPVFLGLLLLVRGLPALVIYRRALPQRRWEMVFLTATALPLLVALTEIGLSNGTMLPENAAALVGAGAISILLFPAIAVALHGRQRPEGPEPGADGEPEPRITALVDDGVIADVTVHEQPGAPDADVRSRAADPGATR